MRPPPYYLLLILPVIVCPYVVACSSLMEKEPHTLRLLIVAAHNLPRMDEASPTDCWVQVYAGARLIGRTPKVHNSNAPRFDTELMIPDYRGEPIGIVAFEEDVTNHELIGHVIIQEPRSGRYQLMGRTPAGAPAPVGEVEVVFESRTGS